MRFGIDFGTTNSSLSFIRPDGETKNVGESGGDPSPLPSVVAVEKSSGKILVGKEAWKRRRELTEDDNWEIVPSIKTLLGTDWKREIAGRLWRPEDIAAEILRTLKEKARIPEVNHAIVSIPIGFTAEKRRALRNAAEKAGIIIDAFTSESTAAFVNSQSAMRADTHVAVFDWGGGTLDISILRNSDGRIRELATSGIPVAGDVIDEKLARFIHGAVARGQGCDCAFEDMPKKDQDQLIVFSEEAKRTLSEEETATISMLKTYGPFEPFVIPIRRDWFVEFIQNIVEDAVKSLKDALCEAHIGMAEIDRILVVGGSSKLVSLKERLIREFGEDRLVFPDDSEWSVSRGAAKLGANGVTCKSAQNVGIVLSSDEVFPMLRKDSPIGGWEGTWQFGITDTSEEAHLVFTGSDDIDQSPDKYRRVSVPAYRFLQESLIIDAWVDENLVFNATARSDMHPVPANEQPVWKYERLKVYYDLNGGGQR